MRKSGQRIFLSLARRSSFNGTKPRRTSRLSMSNNDQRAGSWTTARAPMTEREMVEVLKE